MHSLRAMFCQLLPRVEILLCVQTSELCIINICWILSNSFSEFFEIIVFFLSFILWIFWIVVIDFQMLTTYAWSIIQLNVMNYLKKYFYRFTFKNIFVGFFVYFRCTVLSFFFLVIFLSHFSIQACCSNLMSLEAFSLIRLSGSYHITVFYLSFNYLVVLSEWNHLGMKFPCDWIFNDRFKLFHRYST